MLEFIVISFLVSAATCATIAFMKKQSADRREILESVARRPSMCSDLTSQGFDTANIFLSQQYQKTTPKRAGECNYCGRVNRQSEAETCAGCGAPAVETAAPVAQSKPPVVQLPRVIPDQHPATGAPIKDLSPTVSLMVAGLAMLMFKDT